MTRPTPDHLRHLAWKLARLLGCILLGAALGVGGMLRYGARSGSVLMHLGARFAAAGEETRVLTADEVEATVAEVAAKYVSHHR